MAKPALSQNALAVLERRYLQKNEKGEVIETPKGMFKRVAKNIAAVDKQYDKKADLNNLLMDDWFKNKIDECQASWRRVVAKAVELGIPTPAFSTALAFYDGYRNDRLPANLLQAQRDYFGAHTYERVDKPRGRFFHTNWTGTGGDVSASTYNV